MNKTQVSAFRDSAWKSGATVLWSSRQPYMPFVCVCVCIMSGLTRPIILAASSTIWPQSCPLTKPWRAENTSSQPPGYRRHTCDIYSLWSSFTQIPHQTHTRTRIRTRMHAHTHAHTHTRWCCFNCEDFHRFLLFLYWPNNIFYCPTPTIPLNLALTRDILHFKKTSFSIFNN